MNVQRLTDLRDLLIDTFGADPPNIVFDMTKWFDFPVTGEYACGTAVCACGLHALQRPQDGLQIASVVYDDRRSGSFPQITALPPTTLRAASEPETLHADHFVLYYQQGDTVYIRLQAAEAFYEVSHRIAELLFTPDEYPEYPVPPSHVIDRLNELLQTGTIVVDTEPENDEVWSENYDQEVVTESGEAAD
jgi:hypothetical protein